MESGLRYKEIDRFKISHLNTIIDKHQLLCFITYPFS